MTDTQILTIAMSTTPTMLIVLVGILINNARLGDLGNNFNSRFNDLNPRLGETHARIAETNARIGELRSPWTCASRR
jgi:hypothetical protein